MLPGTAESVSDYTALAGFFPARAVLFRRAGRERTFLIRALLPVRPEEDAILVLRSTVGTGLARALADYAGWDFDGIP